MCKNYFNIILTVSIFALTSFFIGCSEKMDSVNINDSINAAISAKSDSNAVSMTNALKYAYARYPKTKGNNVNLQPIVKDNDTLAFILNYGQGWELLSADERYVPILAHGEGEYDINDLNPGQKFWLDMELDRILNVRLGNIQLDSIDSVSNKLFWARINKPQTLTKADGDPTEGWELVELLGEYKEVLSTNHYISTVWGQSSPWNDCVPMGINTNQRCKVGCVAVAGAQILKYLHDDIGKPSTFYMTGTCEGDLNNYSFSFGNMSSSAWNNMALTSNETSTRTYAAAILLGYVGNEVEMDYGLDGSAALTENLVNLFNSFNISCQYENYSENAVRTSILTNGMPVIVRATPTSANSNGHCWIIDGYNRVKVEYRYLYRYTGLDNPYVEYGDVKIESEYEIREYLVMNWGWNDYIDNTSYSFSGGSWFNSGHSTQYMYNKKIIYNFQ